MTRFVCGLLLAGLAIGPASAEGAADLPTDLKSLVGTTPPSAANLATKSVLQLNTTMFELYDDASKVFRKNILAEHPVILALFSGAGGRLILYRPGMATIEAPPVPPVYQLLKSVGHSTMAISQVVVPYLNNPADKSWLDAMQAYRSRIKSALDNLDALPMQADWLATTRTVLQTNIAFMDDCVAKGVVTLPALEAFTKQQGPHLRLLVAWAAQTQVGHWMGVLADWKAMLGTSWDKAYGVTNSIYVARQNNILFSLLAQFFSPDAMNDRLLLFETLSFTSTPDDILTSLTRIIADRSTGKLFFGAYKLMDYELMGGDARQAIITESAKRGMTPFLPPRVPFGSHQWPTLITPGPGPASLSDLP
jgi:hypothetical protein